MFVLPLPIVPENFTCDISLWIYRFDLRPEFYPEVMVHHFSNIQAPLPFLLEIPVKSHIEMVDR